MKEKNTKMTTREFEELLFSEEMEMYDEPTYIDQERKEAYMKAISILKGMEKKELLTFTFDAYEKPYFITSIKINWNEMATPDNEGVAFLLLLSDSMLIDENEWMLSFYIHHLINENGGKNV